MEQINFFSQLLQGIQRDILTTVTNLIIPYMYTPTWFCQQVSLVVITMIILRKNYICKADHLKVFIDTVSVRAGSDLADFDYPCSTISPSLNS